ncbi:MAG: hypothetical protein RLZZ587_31 [Actinomycetota bacterium]|jgi:hypothetical protein
MTKFSVAAVVVAATLVATPALALDLPSSPSYLSISPCEADCLFGAFIDATDATESDTFEITGLSGDPFDFSSAAAEYNAATGIAFFVTEGGRLFAFDPLNETGLDLLASNASLPTVDGEIVGLAIDDATDTLYALYNDPDAGSYFVVTVDQSTGAIGTPLEMPFVLTMVTGSDFAIVGDKMYVLSGVAQIKIFNLSDGAYEGFIAYPEADNPFFFGKAIDVSAEGVLRIASYNSDSENTEFFSYDLGAGTWSDPLVADGDYDGIAWSADGSEAPAALAETGFDPSGIALAAVAMAGAGALVLRRRARR